jgi:hypothetical protein
MNCGDRATNESVFDHLHRDKRAIEAEYGSPLTWDRLDGGKLCRIAIYRGGTVTDDAENLLELRTWVAESLMRFNAVFTERIRGVLISRATDLLPDLAVPPIRTTSSIDYV